jgi:antitoxin MazE
LPNLDVPRVWIYISVLYIQETVMQVAKWGNSLAVRLPAAVVEALALKEGDDIIIHALGSKEIQIEKVPDRRALLARLRKYRGRLPRDFKFDRLEANER